jgi:arylsulfatase A-like enzyme
MGPLFWIGALTMLMAGAPQEAAKRRPNVLFIAIDDLNDWVGCLGGHPDAKTPNLDRLAARGVLFRRAYCAAPACNPSRASLMTGIRPSSSGVYYNWQIWRDGLKDAVTMQEHFRSQGYFTAGGGKIYHFGLEEPKTWDDFFPLPDRDRVRPPNAPLNGLRGMGYFDWGPIDVPDKEMPDHMTVNWAIDVLGRKHDRPFFLAVGYVMPHLPWYAPRKYFEMFPEDRVALPKINEHDLDDIPEPGKRAAAPEKDHRKVTESNNWRKAVQGYLASIAFVDGQLGRLIDAFDKSPHASNTIVVLYGDNGFHLGEKLHWRKFTLWEESNRVPLLFVAPGTTRAGTRCDRTVDFMGIFPTLMELCGLPAPNRQEGVSLVPLLRDPTARWNRPALMTNGPGNHAVRSERYRYIRYANGNEELYDEIADPMEWNNIAGKPGMEAVKRDLARWLPKKDAPEVQDVRQRGRQRQEK